MLARLDAREMPTGVAMERAEPGAKGVDMLAPCVPPGPPRMGVPCVAMIGAKSGTKRSSFTPGRAAGPRHRCLLRLRGWHQWLVLQRQRLRRRWVDACVQR